MLRSKQATYTELTPRERAIMERFEEACSRLDALKWRYTMLKGNAVFFCVMAAFVALLPWIWR